MRIVSEEIIRHRLNIYIYIYSIKLIAPEKTWRILSDENDNMYIVLQEMSNIFYPHT